MPIHASEDLDAAREAVYGFLSLACTDPRAERWSRLLDPSFQELACAAAEFLARHPACACREPAPGEALAEALDLKPLVSQLVRPREEQVAEYERIFGLLLSRECPPCETEYCPQTFPVHRSQKMADVAGFYNAFGLMPGTDARERPDHIALELEFMAWVIGKERRAHGEAGEEGRGHAETCRDAQRKFVEEHLAWWVPAFARALARKAAGPPELEDSSGTPETLQGAVAGALASFIGIERALLDIEPPEVLVSPKPSEPAGEGACSGCPPA